PHGRGPPVRRGEPRDGTRGVGIDGAGRGRGGARPVHPGRTARRHDRADGPRRHPRAGPGRRAAAGTDPAQDVPDPGRRRSRRAGRTVEGEDKAMDDRIRVSDADRDRVTARLREQFGEGRLTQDELDGRISAALNAKTFGDLRRVMVDLPEPAPVPPRTVPSHPWAGPPHPWAGPHWIARRRGPRLLPLVLL